MSENYDREDLNATLFDMVINGLIEAGIDENGEVVYWMTDEQKAAYNESLKNDEDYY
jgi:hypothetical protein